jgi:transcriptional regulator with XRE-family HTH domain
VTENQTPGTGPDEVERRDYAALVDSLAGTLDVRSGLAEAVDVAQYTAMSSRIANLLDLETGLQSALEYQPLFGPLDHAPQGPEKHMSSRRPHWTLAEKINRLFEVIHPPDRGPWSNQEVERWLTERAAVDGDGLTISANHLLLLRNGQRDNPTARSVQAMAKFFQVDPGYFLRDDADTEQTYTDLQLLGAIRDYEQVKSIALRVFDLDPEMREWLARMINDMPRGRSRRQRNPGAGQHPETGQPPADTDPE